MTDPKGDRSLPPHLQADPDLYLRVVERRPDGIVVRGAKAHQTGFVNSHEVIVMPTQAMGEDDKDYAVAFAVPTDAKGIFMIVGRQSCGNLRNAQPEHLRTRFAGYHRQSYGGCKVGVGDEIGRASCRERVFITV